MLFGFRARCLGPWLRVNQRPLSPLLCSSRSSLRPSLFFSSTTPLGGKGALNYEEWEEKISSFLGADPPPGDHHKEYDHDLLSGSFNLLFFLFHKKFLIDIFQFSGSFESFFEAQDENKVTLSHYHDVMLSLLKNGLHNNAVTVYYALKDSGLVVGRGRGETIERARTNSAGKQGISFLEDRK